MYHPEPAIAPTHSPSSKKEAALRQNVVVVALQSGNNADGGLESLTQLVEHYKSTRLTLFTQRESAKTERWRNAGHFVRILPMPYPPGGGSGDERGAKLTILLNHLIWNVRIGWHVFRSGTQIVHVNDSHALWHCGFLLWLLRVPVLFNIRDTKPSLTRAERLKWRLAFGLSARQVVLSRDMARRWSEALLDRPPRSLQAIYSIASPARDAPPTDSEKLAARESLGLSLDAPLIGYVASFSPKKAQLAFLQNASPLLAALSDKTQVVFVGDFRPESDPYAAACREAARSLDSAGRIHFAGYHKSMNAWFTSFDLVVVATQNEGLARCMIEALAQGTPVISFDVASADEILVGHDCGAVVPRGDYAALFESIRIAFLDTSLRRRWAASAVDATRELFAPGPNARAYEDAYAELAAA